MEISDLSLNSAGKNANENSNGRKMVSFGRLLYEAIPEMWTFQLVSSLLLTIPTTLISLLIRSIAESGGSAMTSANLKSFVLSWRGPAMLVLFIIDILVFVITEVFAQIHMTGNILRGEQVKMRLLLLKGAVSMKQFLNGAGILALLYIFIAAPLCGVGYTISLSSSFYIPHFIMEAILSKKVFAAAYLLAILLLAWLGYRSAFMLHGVLLDKKSPSQARKDSWKLVRENRGKLIGGVLADLLVCGLVALAGWFVFSALPAALLIRWGYDLPKGYSLDFESLVESGFSDTDLSVLTYRILSAMALMGGKYSNSVISLLSSSYFALRYTKRYFAITGRDYKLWPERLKRSRYYKKLLLMVISLILIVILSFITGVLFERVALRDEDVKIIAHRAGGKLASENSLEGLEIAIQHSCYGSEIDVQRTKDGYYVINHDNTFKRVAGVNKAVSDMTLEEIQQLRITDTTGSGALLPVPMFSEMLDIIKGREKLFVELKGSTADTRMVDDLVKMIREAGCVEDCVLISLNYNTIDYAERTYPEFETGTLFFLSVGDVSRLNCDMLIMEEEAADSETITKIHAAGKKAAVWTVNTEDGMSKFLRSRIDAVITDEILLAEAVQKRLDERTDFEIMSDLLL